MTPQDYIGRKVTIRDSGTPRQFTVSSLYGTTMANLHREDGQSIAGRVELNRLDLVPTSEERTAVHKAGYLTMMDTRCTADEATEWFAFVMLQAASLFNNMPSEVPCKTCEGGSVRGNVNEGGDCSDCMNTRVEHPNSRDELTRLLTVRGETETGPVVTAALAYYDAATKWYQDDELERG